MNGEAQRILTHDCKRGEGTIFYAADVHGVPSGYAEDEELRSFGFSLDCSQILAFIDVVALNRIRICDQSRLWQRNYPAAPENSAAL